MFKKLITRTAFTSEAANDMFSAVRGGDVDNDVTLLSTMRALIGPRLGEGEDLSIKVFTRTRDFRSLFSELQFYGHNFSIYNFKTGYYIGQTEEEVMKTIHDAEKFVQETPGWSKIEKVTVFFQKQFYASCFVNPEQKNSIVIIRDMENKELHYLQCGTLAFFPWYFSKEDGITELEMELLKSLREKTSDKYEETLKKLAEKYDFRRYKIEKYLRGFETNAESLELSRYERQLADVIEKINNYNDAMSDLLRDQRLINAKINGLHDAINEKGNRNDFMDFFMRNDNLVVDSADRDTVIFGIKAYADCDKEVAARVIDNERSVIYACAPHVKKDDMRNLFNAIFIDEIVKLRFCAMYQLRVGGNIRGIAHACYGSEFDGYTPNPHIDRFGCMGGYEKICNDIISNSGDYVLVLAQAIESCKSINLNEHPTMSEFIGRIDRSMTGGDMRCIELPDGSIVTPKQAMKYLRGVYEDGKDNQADA